MVVKSYFAPPERAGNEQIRKSSSFLRSKQEIVSVFNNIQEYSVILNKERQILFINTPFLQFLGDLSADDVIGKRPGELIGCVYSGIMDGGCGTARQCRFCGVAQALMESIEKDIKSVKECSITADTGKAPITFEFQVNAMPFKIQDSLYILLTLIDISNQKRRMALERTFFHDILNTASSLQIYSDLLRRSEDPEEKNKFSGSLNKIITSLVDEINSHKLLVSAENRTLKIRHDLIEIHQFVVDIIQRFSLHPLMKNRSIEIEGFLENFSFVSDQTILGRVLVNILKNALEETEEGEKVFIGFSRNNEVTPKETKIWVSNVKYIHNDIQQQIFRRSFSTKGDNRGLGTYSMKLLTENYLKGSVSFTSNRESGTTFTVTIPDIFHTKN